MAFTEKRDSFELYRIPYYEDTAGVAPARRHHLEHRGHVALADRPDERWEVRRASRSCRPTCSRPRSQPAIALPNIQGEARGFWELLNPAYGMGRWTVSYRGHLLAYHGGDIDGFHSQVSFMPQEHIGVIVFVIGDHCASLYNTVSYNVYERLLGMSQTPWSERLLEIRLKGKKAGTEARAKAGAEQVAEHQALAPARRLRRAVRAPRLRRPQDRDEGRAAPLRLPQDPVPADPLPLRPLRHAGRRAVRKWSVNFGTNPQGDVDRAVMSLDEAEATFTRKPETLDPKLLAAARRHLRDRHRLQVQGRPQGGRRACFLAFPDSPSSKLLPYKGLMFRIQEFSDLVFEFVVENGTGQGAQAARPLGGIHLHAQVTERVSAGIVMTQVECIVPILSVATFRRASASTWTCSSSGWTGAAARVRPWRRCPATARRSCCARAPRGGRGPGSGLASRTSSPSSGKYSARGARVRQGPTNYSWAYEMRIEDPDGHVLRFGSEPKPDHPFAD